MGPSTIRKRRVKEVIRGESNSARNLFRAEPKQNERSQWGCFRLIISYVVCGGQLACLQTTTPPNKGKSPFCKMSPHVWAPKDGLILLWGNHYMNLVQTGTLLNQHFK